MDKFICINNMMDSNNILKRHPLTKGKVYIRDESKESNNCVTYVFDDNGDSFGFFSWRLKSYKEISNQIQIL